MKNKSEHRVMAKRVLGYITAFPEKHAQNVWVGNSSAVASNSTKACPTTMCVAGTAVFLDGGNAALKRAIDGESKKGDDVWTETGGELLGLDSDESYALFYTMSNQKARKMLKAVAKGNEKKFEALARTDDDEFSDYDENL